MIKKISTLLEKFSFMQKKQKMIFSATVFLIIVNMIIFILCIKFFLMFLEKIN